ncbi:MAG TPA: MFS transporter [Candidatus Coprenecus stercoravium]|uniref:MFS transporter n=1 Tax=Candidatus Coprenecus stercoravium TaxID=2840735 RepID=A0A9D2GQC2_9BACT|nr:MFS transporter [Candidatus Coprenecus stercoravium]
MKSKRIPPMAWIPTLYVAEGLPYVAVNTLSVIMYKNLGMSNTDIAFYTGWLYLPWVIKPFWSPFVDIIRTKRWWTVTTQFIIGAAFAAIALTLPLDSYVVLSLAVFWLIGFASATHDIAADGYYMLALDSSDQSLYVGIRSAFYRLATIIGQGGVVMAAGWMETAFGNVPKAWAVTFLILSALFLLIAFYHSQILPRPAADRPSGAVADNNHRDECSAWGPNPEPHPDTASTVTGPASGHSTARIFKEFVGTFGSFFQKKHVWIAITFILLYRFPEAQLVKMINPFLLDPASEGGLGLGTAQVGLVYGTIGIIGLTLGGILGGVLVSRYGLKRCLWPMALALTLPCGVFCWMSMAQPDPASILNLVLINACVFIEQFGYGVGFTSFMLYMMYFAEGPSKTSHYAICTAFMALGMMIPGMFAGALQEWMGYVGFFWWIMGCCMVTLGVTALIKVDPAFGLKS